MDLPATEVTPDTKSVPGTPALQSVVVVPVVSSLVGTLVAVGMAAVIVGAFLGMSGRRVSGKAARVRARS